MPAAYSGFERCGSRSSLRKINRAVTFERALVGGPKRSRMPEMEIPGGRRRNTAAIGWKSQPTILRESRQDYRSTTRFKLRGPDLLRHSSSDRDRASANLQRIGPPSGAAELAPRPRPSSRTPSCSRCASGPRRWGATGFQFHCGEPPDPARCPAFSIRSSPPSRPNIQVQLEFPQCSPSQILIAKCPPPLAP